MHIKFDEHDLLEVFLSEPIEFGEHGAGLYSCSAENGDGLEISLSFSVYDKTCDIWLGLNERILFQTELENVEYLRSEDSHRCLRIHQTGAEKDYMLFFRPAMFIMVE